MDSSTEPAAPARTFSQVVFTDIPHSYPPSTAVTCSYTLTADLQPTSRDWVGIFKVGWSSTKDYHTFVWVESCQDAAGMQPVTRQAAFKDYYLPKDEGEFYQFCYVDSAGQVRGASTPFCFSNPAEQSMESSPDDDLLVITTQEQVELSVREKAELQKQLDQIIEEKETLKHALQREQQDAAGLKEQNEQKEREITKLVKELEQTKEEGDDLKSALERQLKEKEEALARMTEQMEEMQQRDAAEQEKRELASGQREEKYNRAVTKIKQLEAEREELRGRVEAQSAEIYTLKSKVREDERELSNMRDGVQLLQVDLANSEKEKAKLSAERQQLQSLAHSVDDAKRENQELRRRLSQQETPHKCPDDDDGLQAQCQTLAGQLQDAQAKLAAEKKESQNARRRAEHVDGDLLQAKQQLETLASTYEQTQRRANKQELQLRELHEMIAEKDGIIADKDHVITLARHEKEELLRDNQNLASDIEGLRRLYAEYHAAPPADSDPGGPPPPQQQEETHTESAAGPEEEQSLVCRHCQEIFPFITREELQQHEQSHRVCPFCTMICDNMEQSVFEDHVYGHEL